MSGPPAPSPPTTPADPIGRGNRNTSLDGLRGLSAMAVLAYHVAVTPGGPTSSWISPVGNLAVAVFFAISGYLLWVPVSTAVLGRGRMPRSDTFFLRRAARLLPGYWVAITIGFWLLDSGRPSSFAETLSHYTLTHVYRRGEPGAGLFVAWTLSAEIAYYLMVAVLAWVLANWRPSGTVAQRTRPLIGIVVGLVLVALVSRQLLASGGTWRLQWPPNLVDWFAAGMLVAVLSARVAVGATVPRIITLLLKMPWVYWVLAAETYLILTRLTERFANGAEIRAIHVHTIYLLVAAASACLLIPLVLGDQGRGPAVVMRWPPMVFLGQISFGLYLWHGVWLPVIDRASANGTIPDAFWPRLVITLAITIPSGWLSWTFVERPAINWAHRRTLRTLAASPPT